MVGEREGVELVSTFSSDLVNSHSNIFSPLWLLMSIRLCCKPFFVRANCEEGNNTEKILKKYVIDTR